MAAGENNRQFEERLSKKRDLKNCKILRDITVTRLPVVSKAKGLILEYGIKSGVDNKFRNNRQILHIQKHYRTNTWKAIINMYFHFIVCEQAFGSAHWYHESIQHTSQNCSVKEKTFTTSFEESETTECFRNETGVKQGWNLSGCFISASHILDKIRRKTVRKQRTG